MLKIVLRSCLLVIFLPYMMIAYAVGGSDQVVLMATTTSTQNSGLLDYLLPRFEADSGLEVRVVAVGTGKALRMAQDGDVDMIMVHAREAEEKFVAAGFGVERNELMYNDFILVGPKSDPAGIGDAKDIQSAMVALAESETPFLSRGDDSGTNKKELRLWAQAGVTPDPAAYRELGQGMGKTLQVANEMQGYTLIDRGTWLAYADAVDLSVLFQGAPELFNQYAVILVNPGRYPGLNTEGARILIKWLLSDRGQELIGAYKVKGETLFTPNASR